MSDAIEVPRQEFLSRLARVQSGETLALSFVLHEDVAPDQRNAHVRVLGDAAGMVPGAIEFCRIGLLVYVTRSDADLAAIAHWWRSGAIELRSVRLAIAVAGAHPSKTFEVLEQGGHEEARLRSDARLLRLNDAGTRVEPCPR
jgi:hypothetical protein